MIKLGRNEIREVIQLTGLADAFNKAVWVEADGKVEMSEVRLIEFWKAHKLPMTTEDYKERLRNNFQLAKHPSLIRHYRKGEFAVVSFDSIAGTGDFIGATERLMVIEFLEDVEFEKDLLLTCRSWESYQEALQPYLQNDLIKLHSVSGVMLFKPLTTLEE